MAFVLSSTLDPDWDPSPPSDVPGPPTHIRDTAPVHTVPRSHTATQAIVAAARALRVDPEVIRHAEALFCDIEQDAVLRPQLVCKRRMAVALVCLFYASARAVPPRPFDLNAVRKKHGITHGTMTRALVAVNKKHRDLISSQTSETDTWLCLRTLAVDCRVCLSEEMLVRAAVLVDRARVAHAALASARIQSVCAAVLCLIYGLDGRIVAEASRIAHDTIRKYVRICEPLVKPPGKPGTDP